MHEHARESISPSIAGRAAAGFTLVELAVVIAIVGFLLGALLLPLSTQVSMRRNQETDQAMNDIVRALYGFAATQGRLPYPDTKAVPDGNEGPNGTGGTYCPTGAAAGSVTVGTLPWQTLGIPPTDAWGHVYRYAVTNEFTCTSVPGMPSIADSQRVNLADVGALAVYTRGDDPSTGTVEYKFPVTIVAPKLTATPPIAGAVAVVLSYGADGAGGYDLDSGTTLPAPAPGTDEAVNAAANATVFVSRAPSKGGTGCNDGAAFGAAPGTTDTPGPFCQFDDIVKWLPTPMVLGELVKAGRLP